MYDWLFDDDEGAPPPPPDPPLFHDTFTGAGGGADLTTHTPDVGNSWSKIGPGVINWQNGFINVTNPAGGAAYPNFTYVVDVEQTDYVVTVNQWPYDTLSGVVVRYQDSENYYLLIFWSSVDFGGTHEGLVSFWKRDAGVWDMFDSFDYGDPGADFPVVVEVDGTLVTVTYNGDPHTFLPMNEFGSSTIMGIHVNPADGLADNFVLDEILVEELP